MFASLTAASLPRECFIASLGGIYIHYEQAMTEMAKLSSLWAGPLNDCEHNMESVQAVMSELLGPFTAPDLETVRLFTDSELQNLFTAAKVGFHLTAMRAMQQAAARGVHHGCEMPLGEEADEEEMDGSGG